MKNTILMRSVTAKTIKYPNISTTYLCVISYSNVLSFFTGDANVPVKIAVIFVSRVTMNVYSAMTKDTSNNAT